jgi:1-aminocyclopropane-1-carboxylate deaminase/D-cysteine desulfhydrase-like pyridoxal-dependent ACC family enzyme
MELKVPSPVIEIENLLFKQAGIQLYIKREDLLHPMVSGNKWRKLKYNLQKARHNGFKRLLTFGGAYSNHIAAVAWAAKAEGFESIGVIRGAEYASLNHTLQQAKDQGMKLHFITREKYKEKENQVFLQELGERFGSHYLIPEGGANWEGVKGVEELGHELRKYSHICVPVGTGTTLAGIINSLEEEQFALGFAVLKGEDYLEERVRDFLVSGGSEQWRINHEFHFGGYAKYNAGLINFINTFKRETKIPLDPVYTGKMMFGVYQLVKAGYFPVGSRLVVIHTGGLQGITGFNQRFGNLIDLD